MKKDFITVSPDNGGYDPSERGCWPQFNISVSLSDTELLCWGGYHER